MSNEINISMKLQELFQEKKQPQQLDAEPVHEGVYDPGIFKAIFLAGGPGAGKTYVGDKLLAGSGLKLLNTDKAFELFITKKGLRKDMPDDEKEERDKLRGRAKEVTSHQKELWVNGRLGLIIDGTAKDLQKIDQVKNELEKYGYDTVMVFVNTSLVTALKRNQERYDKEGGRKVPPEIVRGSWHEVQENMMKYQQLFGTSRFFILDNSGGMEDPTRAQNFNNIWKELRIFINQMPRSPVAQKWIAQQKAKKKSSHVGDTDTDTDSDSDFDSSSSSSFDSSPERSSVSSKIRAAGEFAKAATQARGKRGGSLTSPRYPLPDS